MRKLLILAFITIFQIPAILQAQDLKPGHISPILQKGWVTLAKNWKYKVGDNPEWATPSFNDASWDTLTSSNFFPEKLMGSPEENNIIWFRKSIFIDSTINEKMVAKVFQSGASEIYLNGKLIHQLGKVSNNPDSVVINNSGHRWLDFPFNPNKEHLLAIRFVSTYGVSPLFKNAKNSFIRMQVARISRAKILISNILDNRPNLLMNDWRYNVGDNFDWASTDFNDSLWQTTYHPREYLEELSTKIGTPKIVWFRKTIKTDNKLNQNVVARIFQSGASEIYLDGRLIHKLGKVHVNPDSVIPYNPYRAHLSFPLQKNQEHILAIRFLNSPNKFPMFSIRPKSFLSIYISTLQNATISLREQERKAHSMYYVVIGIAAIMFILFLSLFIFFPKIKINLYFSLSNLIMVLFLISLLYSSFFNSPTFKLIFLTGCLSAINVLLLYYCFYKVFNQKLGIIYWSVFILEILQIPALFLFDMEIISPLFAVFILIEIIRISIKTIKDKNKGAYIILIFIAISSFFWTAILLNHLSILDTPVVFNYQPFAFALFPISIAIYIAYSFGIINQKLRNKLIEVDQLSNEKQQILATQNITLEKQVKERTHDLNQSLEHLKSTQSQLIQSEKMASLGELTAGIAHEIQNPLNFVNNFSDVSKELIGEMKEELVTGNLQPVTEISDDISQNLDKILHHGKRAEAIVKGMLQHSRTSAGKKELTDINKLADEYLRLSYHGLRAKDKSFNADFKTEFDETLPKINVIPQDIGRVLLNLINNAFYAVDTKAKGNTPQPPKGGAEEKKADYKPLVIVSTELFKSPSGDLGVKISVKDNANGIPPEIKDKIFQPFFTTKPTGSGTGLGLSLSYDIVKAHSGEITVESTENEGTSFTVMLISS